MLADIPWTRSNGEVTNHLRNWSFENWSHQAVDESELSARVWDCSGFKYWNQRVWVHLKSMLEVAHSRVATNAAKLSGRRPLVTSFWELECPEGSAFREPVLAHCHRLPRIC
jgi:hypothetical protein